jgi:hypothetical protein
MGHFVGNATYQCLHCQLARRAEVRTVMVPERRARGAGRGDANSTLAMLLALKRCPRCGHYDRAIESYHRHNRRAGVIGAVLVLAIVALALVAIPAVPREVLAGTLAALALGFVVVLRRLHQRYPTNVEARVQLVGSSGQRG